MNYLRFKAEDLIMDESFQQYCSGTNPAATRFWEQWLKEHPEKSELVSIAKTLYLQLNGGLNEAVFQSHHRQFSEALEARGIRPGKQIPPARIVHPKNGWGWYALAVAAVLGIIMTTLWIQRDEQPGAEGAPEESRLAYTSKAGERKSFQLPDGTKVMLNAGSTLFLEDSFNTAKRSLTLEGEAFFDVAQHASMPFVIHTSAMDITVLGTAFNVKAYKNDETNETSLVRGLVKVSLRSGAHELLLHPNEKVVVPLQQTTKQQIKPAPDDRVSEPAKNYSIASLTHIPLDSTAVELSWIDNRLIFVNEPFGEIARRLERWYDVKIRFESENMKQYRFTGNFDKENLQRVLEVLQLSRDFSFRFENGHSLVLDQ
ncbi:FecR family protein [Chitinophaga sp. XS-30]|uniref:FecR family protein n=1 Tax=Chitinophaga sp. XS-30 TaxID=2604421 RepID=UPI0011DD79A6|nr:FecR domain-containing protein [Chitinophaga sp. XS-30]QEH41314.1 FecR family protein [Chitinophaga sp. XS-30]